MTLMIIITYRSKPTKKKRLSAKFYLWAIFTSEDPLKSLYGLIRRSNLVLTMMMTGPDCWEGWAWFWQSVLAGLLFRAGVNTHFDDNDGDGECGAGDGAEIQKAARMLVLFFTSCANFLLKQQLCINIVMTHKDNKKAVSEFSREFRRLQTSVEHKS